MAVPASAAKADMYAASIGLARCVISCGFDDEFIGAENRHSPILGNCRAAIPRWWSLGKEKSRRAKTQREIPYSRAE
jgi:hypothetical protein